jgi:hypothetical protein
MGSGLGTALLSSSCSYACTLITEHRKIIPPRTALVALKNLIIASKLITQVWLRSTNQDSARRRVTAQPKISLPWGLVSLDQALHCHAHKIIGDIVN